MPSFSSLSLYTLQALSLFTSFTTAYPGSGSSKILPRQTCTNSASDRSCWGDYSLTTNYYDEVPDTGVVREFYLELVNTTLAPDGVSRNVLTVNGTIPGPTLEADWGDTIVVHVTNSLQNNGTSIHFHGVRQNYTNQMDGVASITQCPTAPGNTITYTWRATQYGSSWYHSHYSLQAWEGVFGGIVIHGPASANYDEDLGNLFLSDWDHQTVDELYLSAATNGPPTLDTGLINGTNVYNGAGAYFEQTFISDTSYLIRVLNVGVDTFFKFSIDNHTMTVIAMDFVPIEPFTTDILSLGIAQRYDIIVNATAPAGNYWMRAIPQQTCSNNANVGGILGIIRYDSTSTANPTSTGYAYTDDCNNEDSSLLVPYLALNAGTQSVTENLEITLDASASGIVYWDVNNSSMNVSMDTPTLLEIMEGVTSFQTRQNVYTLDTAGEWVYLIIEQTSAAVHPIHLHGHDFYVLASGTGTYASAAPTLNLANPPRRDVQMLPAAGYIVLAFITDNPGAWLMHCHIGWHQSLGLDLQFIEQRDLIPGLTDNSTVTDSCEAWTLYAREHGILQVDSGV